MLLSREQVINIPLVKVISYIFVFFCFFPYLNILRIPTDAQPNALVFGLLLVALSDSVKFRKTLLVFFVAIFLAFFAGFIWNSTFKFSSFRSLVNYLSLSIITIASIFFLKRNKLSYRFFNFSVISYFVVSIIQTLTSKTFLTFLLYRSESTESRGVTGLAPEPTFNATMGVLFLVIYLLNFFPYRLKYHVAIFLIWIVFLAKSSTILLVLVASFFLYSLVFYFNRTVIAGIFFFVIVIASLQAYLANAASDNSVRLVTLMNALVQNPDTFLIFDKSINDRFSHIFAAFYLSFENYLMPFGPDYKWFNTRIFELKSGDFYYVIFFDKVKPQWERIMSGWGMLVYECGLAGFLFLVYFNLKCILNFRMLKPYFLAFVIFTITLFTALSINTAIVPFIFGNFFFILFYKLNE